MAKRAGVTREQIQVRWDKLASAFAAKAKKMGVRPYQYADAVCQVAYAKALNTQRRAQISRATKAAKKRGLPPPPAWKPGSDEGLEFQLRFWRANQGFLEMSRPGE